MDLSGVVRDLEVKKAAALAEVRRLDKAIEGLKALRGSVVSVDNNAQVPTSQAYANMGISEAARSFIKAAGRPLTTRDITDGLINNGWTTRSRNVSQTVYATLKNAKSEWKRNEQGEWEYFGAR